MFQNVPNDVWWVIIGSGPVFIVLGYLLSAALRKTEGRKSDD